MKLLKILLLFCLMVSIVAKIEAQKSGINIDSLKKAEEDLWYVDEKKALPPIDTSQTEINGEPTKKPKKGYEPMQLNWAFIKNLGPLLEILLYFAVFVLIGYIVVRFAKLDIFGRNNRKSKNIEIEENTIIEDEETLQEISFENQILQAEKAENYRLATRLNLLHSLQKLSVARQIKYHIKKTNEDYTQEISEPNAKNQFAQCVAFYNRIWFGETTINYATYQQVKAQFTILNHNYSH